METTKTNATQEGDGPGSGTPRNGCRGGRHGRGGRRLFAGLLLIALAAAAGFAGGVAGRSHAWSGAGSPFSASADPAKAQQRVERMIARVADKVDATPEQRQKLDSIAKGAAQDLLALRGNVVQARTRGIELLGAPVVDRVAVEKLRTEQIALADAASKRLTQALTDAADVLSVEQRKVLAERAQRFGERHGQAHG